MVVLAWCLCHTTGIAHSANQWKWPRKHLRADSVHSEQRLLPAEDAVVLLKIIYIKKKKLFLINKLFRVRILRRILGQDRVAIITHFEVVFLMYHHNIPSFNSMHSLPWLSKEKYCSDLVCDINVLTLNLKMRPDSSLHGTYNLGKICNFLLAHQADSRNFF